MTTRLGLQTYQNLTRISEIHDKDLKTSYQHIIRIYSKGLLISTREIATQGFPIPSLDSMRQELPELFDDLNQVLRKFKKKTGANDQYIYMILGALSNEYRKKGKEVSETAWK